MALFFRKEKRIFKTKTEENQAMRQEAKIQEKQKIIQEQIILPQTTYSTPTTATQNYYSIIENNIPTIKSQAITNISAQKKKNSVIATIMTKPTIGNFLILYKNMYEIFKTV